MKIKDRRLIDVGLFDYRIKWWCSYANYVLAWDVQRMTRPIMKKMDEVLYMTRCFMAQGHKHAEQSFVDKVALEFFSRQDYVG